MSEVESSTPPPSVRMRADRGGFVFEPTAAVTVAIFALALIVRCLLLDVWSLARTVTRSPGLNGLLGRKLAPV